ncbi:MAG: hypothetical protein IJB96_00740 [Lachnospira sp.]|nr:hypothetical protein [Lachnospira sp.]
MNKDINGELLVTAVVNIVVLSIATSSLALGMVNMWIPVAVIVLALAFLVMFDIRMSKKITVNKDKVVNVILLVVGVLAGVAISAFLILKNILHVI